MSIASEEHQPGSNNQEFYPFSLVLGTNFKPSPVYSVLSPGDREVRARLNHLIGPSNPQALGRLVNILADGQIRFRDIPEVEPHLYKGVTFNDPDRLYREWGRRADVGPVLGEMMRTLIRNSTRLNANQSPAVQAKTLRLLRRRRK